MGIKVGVVMDDLSAINMKKDSSFAMMLAAQKLGWEIHTIYQKDLFTENEKPRAYSRITRVDDNPEHWFDFATEHDIDLSDLDVILMRKDPPFDIEYIASTYILDQAEQQDVILKPLDGMGGTSIYRVNPQDPNLSVILETVTENESRTVMAQQFIPEITEGDKRILLIDGKAAPYALARIPATGETRGNLAAGGTGVGMELSERDIWICQQVGPVLKQKGILFAGIDIIGDYLTEINITSPTCIRELDQIYALDIAGDLMQCIKQYLP
jgi:glutathione synthase